MNYLSKLAESQRWVLWATIPGWQREDHPAGTKPRGFRVAGPVPFPTRLSARDAARHRDERFCRRDTTDHSSVGKTGTSPVKASGNWGQAAHVGETGEVARGWRGTGAANGAGGAWGFAARLVSTLQGHRGANGLW